TQILAQELSEYNICVNAVNPGATRTKMRAEAFRDEDPLTLPHPDEIIDLFVNLASDNSRNLTGKSLNLKT
ncbi:MAG: SDR family oxidoreductase, partial [Spirochaetota bacterium]|nr:SDR family oxidoreductase [Spirochaetota bacterium]